MPAVPYFAACSRDQITIGVSTGLEQCSVVDESLTLLRMLAQADERVGHPAPSCLSPPTKIKVTISSSRLRGISSPSICTWAKNAMRPSPHRDNDRHANPNELYDGFVSDTGQFGHIAVPIDGSTHRGQVPTRAEAAPSPLQQESRGLAFDCGPTYGIEESLSHLHVHCVRSSGLVERHLSDAVWHIEFDAFASTGAADAAPA